MASRPEHRKSEVARAPAVRVGRSGVPLYHRIFLTLRDEILSGERRPGAFLPTEMELCSAFDVSRITARRALAELEASRLVERRRRLGTRVTYRGAPKAIEAEIDRAVEALVAFGHDTAAEVLAIHRICADDTVAEQLGVPVGEDLVRAVRLRRLDGEPLGLVTSFAREELSGLMTRERLSTTPILEILQTAGFAIGSARQKIMAALASPELAAQLDVEQRSAILRIQRVTCGVDGRPLLLTVAEYRGDRYHLAIDLVEGRSGSATQHRSP